jgi:polyisoprenyl-phosphate glycosyltransferase
MAGMLDANPGADHSLAVVIPVYRGETTLPDVLRELAPYHGTQTSPAGQTFYVREVVLVHDSGPDRSDETIRALVDEYPFVHAVWLARNFGQHAATLAGMSSTSSDWIVTMDEDGQHDPAALGRMLDTALQTRSPLVYAAPTNKPPHGTFRNMASAVAHRAAQAMGAGGVGHFHSYRLVLGEVGRGLAAYCGESVYLDIALTWVVGRTATCPVAMREERGRASGYSPRRLASHFWRMVLTSGTRPLRLVAFFGMFLAFIALILVVWVVWVKLTTHVSVQGWTSMVVILLATSGATLFSLGIVAEYLGIAARTAMGKPLYLVVSDPAGPLGVPAAPTAQAEPAREEPPVRANA